MFASFAIWRLWILGQNSSKVTCPSWTSTFLGYTNRWGEAPYSTLSVPLLPTIGAEILGHTTLEPLTATSTSWLNVFFVSVKIWSVWYHVWKCSSTFIVFLMLLTILNLEQVLAYLLQETSKVEFGSSYCHTAFAFLCYKVPFHVWFKHIPKEIPVLSNLCGEKALTGGTWFGGKESSTYFRLVVAQNTVLKIKIFLSFK